MELSKFVANTRKENIDNMKSLNFSVAAITIVVEDNTKRLHAYSKIIDDLYHIPETYEEIQIQYISSSVRGITDNRNALIKSSVLPYLDFGIDNVRGNLDSYCNNSFQKFGLPTFGPDNESMYGRCTCSEDLLIARLFSPVVKSVSKLGFYEFIDSYHKFVESYKNEDMTDMKEIIECLLKNLTSNAKGKIQDIEDVYGKKGVQLSEGTNKNDLEVLKDLKSYLFKEDFSYRTDYENLFAKTIKDLLLKANLNNVPADGQRNLANEFKKVKLIVLHLHTEMAPCAKSATVLSAVSYAMNNIKAFPALQAFLDSNGFEVLKQQLESHSCKFLVEVSCDKHYSINERCAHAECAGRDGLEANSTVIRIPSPIDNPTIIPYWHNAADKANWTFRNTFPPYCVYSQVQTNGTIKAPEKLRTEDDLAEKKVFTCGTADYNRWYVCDYGCEHVMHRECVMEQVK
ncbi:MAG: hypothetical protein LBS83_03955 [Holosporales bacterium]|jgi:hypothetical protein|nr:hypothetical protein [Holosporales bacterium]